MVAYIIRLMFSSFYHKFPYFIRYTWPKKCSSNPLWEGQGMAYRLFGWVIILIIAIINSNYQIIYLKLLPLHVNLHLMLWLKLKTFHPQFMPLAPPTSLLRLGNFMK